MEKWKKFWQDYRDIPIQNDSDLLYQVAVTVSGKPISNELFNFMILNIQNNLQLNKDDNLLDLCCGNGVLTFELSKKVKKTIGIDSSKLYIENAKKYKNSSSIEYVEMDILDLEKNEKFNLQEFSKVLIQGSIPYFDEKELTKILKGIYKLTDENVIILFGNILDYSKRFKFYNTYKRKWDYIYSKIFDKDKGLGNWWEKNKILNISNQEGFNCIFIEQNSRLNTAHYRFDCILTKISHTHS